MHQGWQMGLDGTKQQLRPLGGRAASLLLRLGAAPPPRRGQDWAARARAS